MITSPKIHMLNTKFPMLRLWRYGLRRNQARRLE